MQQFINQYSFIFVGLLLILFILIFVSRLTSNRTAFIACIIVVVIFMGVQTQIKSTTDQYDTVEDFDKAVASEYPVFLFLYSDY